MPTLDEELAADLAAGIADYGQTFEWAGTTYACVRNPAPTMLRDDEGGFVEGIEFSILVATAAFTGGLPAIGDAVDASAAQIKRLDTNRAQLILHCGSFDA